jgi:hypothetical protein
LGCNCGGTATVDQYVVTLPDGTVKIANSDVQARQWIARAGGGVMRKAPQGEKVS